MNIPNTPSDSVSTDAGPDSSDIIETEGDAGGPEPKWSEGPATFDELDSRDDNNRLVPEKNESEEGGEESEGEEEESVDADSSEEETAKVPETPKSTKTITLKINGKEVKAPEDATITLTVDGKPKEVKLSDIKTDINGREFYAKKASEADLKTKQAETKLKEVQPYLEEMGRVDMSLQRIQQCVDKGDGFGAWVEIMRMQGKDLKSELPAFIKQTSAVKERWEKMSPEQRDALIAKEAAERAQIEAGKKEQSLAQENKQLKFEKYVNDTERKTNIPRKELDWYWDELAKIDYFKQERFQTKEFAENPEKYVDAVVEYIEIDKRYNNVEAAIKEISPEHLKDEKYVHKIAGVVKAIQDAEKVVFSKQDIADIVRGNLGISVKPKSTANGKKVEASSKQTATPSKVASSSRTPSKKEPNAESGSVNTWDDLERWQ